MNRPVPLFALLFAALALGAAQAQPPPAPPVEARPGDEVVQEGEDPEEREFEVEPVDPAAPPAPPVTPPSPTDPAGWWEGHNRAPVRVDPLGDRRARRNDPKLTIDNGAPPLLYRLWGLPPLQTLVMRPGEVVIEVWMRPSGASQEAISRVTVRRDNKVFVQARAGMGCCRPEIARRVDIDQMPDIDPAPFKALAKSPVWREPKEVEVEHPTIPGPICVKGAGYDLTLVEYDRTAHLRRVCDLEAIGQVAPVLQAVIGAALGKDPRFDVLIKSRGDFSFEAGSYQRLIEEGGRLAPKTFKP